MPALVAAHHNPHLKAFYHALVTPRENLRYSQECRFDTYKSDEIAIMP